jgi:uncharacterized protein YigE (DUF2233 family)
MNIPSPVMIKKYNLYIVLAALLICTGATPAQQKDPRFLSFVTAPSRITLFWKDDNGQILGSIQNLKVFAEAKKNELTFAMNGGMYKKDQSPQGLFIENGVTHTPLDTLSGNGNFYLQPNGVFYITGDDKPVICQTTDFVHSERIKFATQSGPMLLIDGQVHPAFKKGSANLNIRNGVGILPDNTVVFAMSKQEVNFYDLAEFFKGMGCQYALYLDGFVSRTYLPEQNWKQLDGNFGVIIGVVE